MNHIFSIHLHKRYRVQLVAFLGILAIQVLFPQAPAIAQSLPFSGVETATEQIVVAAFPEIGLRPARYAITVPVTAYSSTPDQTDDTPFITASGTHVRHGVIAANFLPIGTHVRLPDHYGDQVFVVEDRMNARYDKRMDIWMETREAAKQWGLRKVRVEVL